ALIQGLEAVSEKQLPVVLPLHPRTRAKLDALGYDRAASPIRFIEPVGYFEMVWLLQHCSLVMTDSGGVQKEAFFFRRPCVTLRNETEWVELVAGGYNRLTGSRPDEITAAAEAMLAARPDYSVPLYGDGKSGEAIVKKLME
ncbi:MAG: UDP-N-acetylglucosamine 2-epimerase, partial [Bacteroidales bacterium]|nr:UDP-N-acetylglucosamine 2-epimerase [Bacteroidales bacterium]